MDDKKREREIKDGFGDLWGRFASDFLNEKQNQEYNSLKHGLRLRPGGFTLAVGTEETPGVGAPPERMRSLGGSEFGSTYILPQAIGTAPKNHFRLRECHLNWLPGNHVVGLQLLSMSIRNVLAFLRGILTSNMGTSQFTWSTPTEAFRAPWAASPGTNSFEWNLDLTEGDITVLSDEEIMKVYRPGEPGAPPVDPPHPNPPS
jgi:hypothetical protein